MATLYFDNVVIGDTLTVVGQTSTTETIATLTITGHILSNTAFATPSALSATGARWFASTVSGGVLMGYGTTNDVALMNRAGTVVLGVGPNTTAVNIPGTLAVTGAVTASGAAAVGSALTLTPTAAANSDVLTVLTLTMVAGTPGAFTGLVRRGLSVPAFTVVGDTSPGNPVGINVGVITGTGASVATALQLAPPTGATTNYLIAHTTAATFNVQGNGTLSVAAAGFMGFTGRSYVSSASDGVLLLSNSAVSDFTRLQFGGTSTSFPALARNTTAIEVLLADGSAYTALRSLTIGLRAGTAITAGGIQMIGVSSTTTFGVYAGSGAPTVSAAQGSLYLRSDGSSTSTRLYVNTDGGTTWTNVTTAA